MTRTFYELYMAGYQLGTIHIHFQQNVDFVTKHNYIVYMIVLYTNYAKLVFDAHFMAYILQDINLEQYTFISKLP